MDFWWISCVYPVPRLFHACPRIQWGLRSQKLYNLFPARRGLKDELSGYLLWQDLLYLSVCWRVSQHDSTCASLSQNTKPYSKRTFQMACGQDGQASPKLHSKSHILHPAVMILQSLLNITLKTRKSPWKIQQLPNIASNHPNSAHFCSGFWKRNPQPSHLLRRSDPTLPKAPMSKRIVEISAVIVACGCWELYPKMGRPQSIGSDESMSLQELYLNVSQISEKIERPPKSIQGSQYPYHLTLWILTNVIPLCPPPHAGGWWWWSG